MNEKDLQSINEAKTGFISDAIKDVTDVDIKSIIDDVKKNEIQHGDTFGTGVQKVSNIASSIASKGITPAGDTAKELDKMMSKSRVDNRSIFARARNSVMQFPCYITQSIPVNAAHVISQTFERVYASFVQTAISQTKIIDEAEANDLLFLKRFHTNIRESADVLYNGFYEPIDEFDQIMKESVFHRERISDTMMVEFSAIPAQASEFLIKESARLSADPLAGFTYLQEADNDDNKKGFIARKAAKRDEVPTSSTSSKSTEESSRPLTADEEFHMVTGELNLSSRDIQTLRAKPPTDDDESKAPGSKEVYERLWQRYDAKLRQIKTEIKNGTKDREGYTVDNAGRICKTIITTTKRSETGAAKAPDVRRGPDTPVLLKDNEIRKLNAMQPYMIQCHFIIRSQGKLDQEAHYIIGVKTIMHLIRPQDLSEDLRDLVTGRIKSLQKVKYKSGEIGWWDYIFHKKQIKKDAAKGINGNKRWLNTLKRLSEFDKVHGSLMRGPITGLNKGEIPIPNATLILSQPDVTRLTAETGIDLSVVSNSVRLAKSLYLICVAIVDASAGTMRYIFPDSMSDWDVQSIASMEAEVAKTDNSQLMRELNHLVNK